MAMTNGRLGGVVRRLDAWVSARGLNQLSDGELLDQFARGNTEAAFAALVGRHGSMVFGVCRRLLHNAHDAEDAFQATFLILLRRARALDRRPLASWLYTVAYRVATKANADAARRRRREQAAARAASVEQNTEALGRDLWPVLDQELNRLPDKSRAPVALCYLEGRTTEEAARSLGWPAGTVKSRLARARELLRSRLARRGVTLSAGAFAAALGEAAPAAVPASLVAPVVRLAAGGSAAPAAALAEGVMRAMLVTKLKNAAVLALAVGVAALGAGALAHRAWARHAADETVRAEPSPSAAPQGRAGDGARAAPVPDEKPQERPKPQAAQGRVKAEDTETFSFPPTKGAPRVHVETFNGGVLVTAAAVDRVTAKVLKSAAGGTQQEAQDDLKNIVVTFDRKEDVLTVTARPRNEQPNTNRAARVELRVPAGAALTLNTSNGEIDATGQTGDVAAHSSNGAVRVEGSKGKLRLTTNNGSITVEGGSGQMDLKTSNGAVTVRAENVVVAAHTSNGAIRFSGSLAKGEHSFETTNGGVGLTLPAGAQFRVDAATSHGKCSSDFPVSGAGGKGKNELRGTVGENPAFDVKLRTSNGSIALRKKP